MINDKNIKMNLQLLAEHGDDQNVENNTNVDDKTKAGDGTGDGKKGSKNEEKRMKYTDEDVDRIIEDKFKKWKKQQEKELSEAQKLADMTAQEKIEYERDNLKKELEELRNAKALSEMSKTARAMLKEKDIDIDDDLLSVLVTKDAEKTKANVDTFSTMFDKAVQTAVNSKLKGNTPKAGKTHKLTKEDILKIENRHERQKLIAENLDLFE